MTEIVEQRCASRTVRRTLCALLGTCRPFVIRANDQVDVSIATARSKSPSHCASVARATSLSKPSSCRCQKDMGKDEVSNNPRGTDGAQPCLRQTHLQLHEC